MDLTQVFTQANTGVIYNGLMEGSFFMNDQEYEVKSDFETHFDENETGRHEYYKLTGVEELIRLDVDGTKIEVTPEIDKFIMENFEHE